MRSPLLTRWKTPASAYPNRRRGKARIRTTRYRGYYECYGLRGYKFYRARGIRVKVLQIAGKTWMVDDPPHWWAMQEHAAHYRGHVLCAGLGLGLIVHTLDANPAVDRITVIEREKDVIDLVSPYLPHGKLAIEHRDFWDYDGPDPDGILYDLFVGDGRELFHQALRVYFQLCERWPEAEVRIHGFNNRAFEPLREAIRSAARAAPNLLQRTA